MSDGPQPRVDSPHQKMLDFLAESDEVNSGIVPADPDWSELEKKIHGYLKDE
jgi:hypothetical protein